MNIDNSIQRNENIERMPYELFKSEICHRLKSSGDLGFIKDILINNIADEYYDRGWYIETLYIVALVDYLCRINNIPLYTGYNKYRNVKLPQAVYSDGTLLIDAFAKNDKAKEKAMQDAIPEFRRFNIIECEVRDVV